MKALPRPSRCWGWRIVQPQDPGAHYITNALKAKELFVKDVNYIVRDGEAVIVDEFTGRVMPGRRWSMAAPGHRGQGGPADPTGNADPRLDHLPELFPALPPSGRHDRYRETEEVEFEKTYKPKPRSFHQPFGPARTGPTRCTKPKRPSGGPPTKPLKSTRRAGRCLWAQHQWRKASC